MDPVLLHRLDGYRKKITAKKLCEKLLTKKEESYIRCHWEQIKSTLGAHALSLLADKRTHASTELFRFIIQDLLNSGYTLQDCTNEKSGLTLLHFAADRGNVNLLCLLIEKGVDVNEKDRCGHTAMQMAVCAGQYPIVRMLYYAGARLEEEDSMFHTTLFDYFPKGGRNVEKMRTFIFTRTSLKYLCRHRTRMDPWNRFRLDKHIFCYFLNLWEQSDRNKRVPLHYFSTTLVHHTLQMIEPKKPCVNPENDPET